MLGLGQKTIQHDIKIRWGRSGSTLAKRSNLSNVQSRMFKVLLKVGGLREGPSVTGLNCVPLHAAWWAGQVTCPYWLTLAFSTQQHQHHVMKDAHMEDKPWLLKWGIPCTCFEPGLSQPCGYDAFKAADPCVAKLCERSKSTTGTLWRYANAVLGWKPRSPEVGSWKHLERFQNVSNKPWSTNCTSLHAGRK